MPTLRLTLALELLPAALEPSALRHLPALAMAQVRQALLLLLRRRLASRLVAGSAAMDLPRPSPGRSCSSAVIGHCARRVAPLLAAIDALEAVADGVPLAEGVEDEASGALAAALERRGGMESVAHGARSSSRRAGRPGRRGYERNS